MLKNIMGEEAFWNAVKDYIKTNLYSIVETGKARLGKSLFARRFQKNT